MPLIDDSSNSETPILGGNPHLSDHLGVTTDASKLPDPRNGIGDLHPPLAWRDVSLTEPGENRMVVLFRIAGKAIEALIDSGAHNSLVNFSTLTDLGIDFSPSERVVYGFGRKNKVDICGQVRLEGHIPGLVVEPVNCDVIKLENCKIPLILGSDFLRQNKLQLNLSQGRISQKSPEGHIVDLYVSKGMDLHYRMIPCKASKDVCLVAGVLEKIPVEVADRCDMGDSLLLFEPHPSNKNLVPLAGICNYSRNMSVLAQSRSESTLRISCGDVLGYIRSVQVVEEPCWTTQERHQGEEESITAILNSMEIGRNLSSSQRQAVVDVLRHNTGVLSRGDHDIGMLVAEEHHIELLDTVPIYQKPRRLPDPLARELEQQCEELNILDVIEHSKSPWSSPIVPVRKKDGSIRLCVDYRRLNAVTKPDRFPLPNLSESIYSLQGKKYLTSFELVRGYYQLPLDEQSREYTAFSTPHNHWQFKRLPFGLRNAPSAFQRQMQRILSEFPWGKVIVYIDDLLIMTETFEEHLSLLSRVLSVLSRHGVKVKPPKCKWLVEEVEYLGHIVSREGLRKPPQYLDKVNEFPMPTTVRQLREFLGLVNFQRKFVANFSSLQKPLSEKLVGRGSRKLKWTRDMEAAFLTLKEKIKEDLLLSFPDFSAGASPLELFVDASDIGAGACLTQQQDGDVRVIAFASMTFNVAERRYSVIEKELAGLRWGVKSFRPFLIGTEFLLYTDHQPLIYLNNMKLIDGRLARTLEDLADYNFRILYLPGKTNCAADALSRLAIGDAIGVGPSTDGSFVFPPHLRCLT